MKSIIWQKINCLTNFPYFTIKVDSTLSIFDFSQSVFNNYREKRHFFYPPKYRPWNICYRKDGSFVWINAVNAIFDTKMCSRKKKDTAVKLLHCSPPSESKNYCTDIKSCNIRCLLYEAKNEFYFYCAR